MPNQGSQRRTDRPPLHPQAAAEILAALDRVEGVAEADAVAPLIEGYRLVERIGAGGGGVVYLAFRGQSDQPLAIKILHARIIDETGLRRAWRELDVLREIRHPAVPRLIDHGQCERGLFLVTEFIEGTPLDRHCSSQQLDIEQRVELLARAADAAQALHEHGVIHRDVKPGNILIDARGQATLIDLGIATLLDQRDLETLTLAGEPIGSPACMSPEQARGERETISTRSDVYGLGATACLLLTGNTPHDLDAPLHEVVRRIGNDEPRDPRMLKPDLPRPLAAVLRKAVSPRPQDRYGSAAEFAEDLRRWLRHEPVEAAEPTAWQRAVRAVAQHPVLATAAACALIAALTLLMTWGAVVWFNARPAHFAVDQYYHRWARLLARSGRVIHEWRAPENLHMLMAQVIERPAASGGGKVILIGYGGLPAWSEDAELRAYDFDDPLRILWRTGTGPPHIEMPDPISRVEGEWFGLSFATAADIFTERPGIEVLTVDGHTVFSPNVIRIWSIDGELLYQVWHDGGLGEPRWISQWGQIVVAGLNSENNWAGRGFDGAVRQPYPMIVMGLKPQLGRTEPEWIRTPGGLGTRVPEWYRALQPPQVIEQFARFGLALDVYQVSADQAATAPTLCSVDVHGAREGAWMRYFIDEKGRVVSRVTTAMFETSRIERGLPAAEDLILGDLLPLVIDPRNPPGP